MGLSQSTLSSDIMAIFKDMYDNHATSGYDGNKKFSQGVSKAFKDFGESGTITTTDTGTVALGDFTGSGTGQLSLSDSSCESIIYSATQDMQDGSKRDEYFAGKIAEGLSAMYGESNIVSTTVNGTITLTTPPPPTKPVVGASGVGSISCSFDSVKSGLVSFFRTMMDGSKKDIDFANKLAELVYSAVSSGVVSTTDSGDITGASGTGSIT